jgi:putative ABC transport system ATP-binding protein
LARTSAIENVELPLIYAGISAGKRRQMAKERLVQVGLEDRLDHKPNQLSGGQQQRVAIARALVNNPKIIMADEPTGNLDSKSGLEIIKMLHNLHVQNHTIILVTHDLNLAKEAHRQIILRDGEIISDNKK